MSVTDVIKESLHYPFYDKIKIVYFGILYAIMGICSTIISYLISNPLLHSNYASLANGTENVTTLTQSVNLIAAQIPSTNWYYVIILGIIALVVGILATGYDFRVIKKAINSENTLPKFNNFISMFIEGLKIIVVEIIYAILPIILLSIGFTIIGLGNGGSNATLLSIGSIVCILGFLFTIFMVLVQLMAVNHMIANDGKISYAFKFKDVVKIIGKVSWIRYIGALFMLVIISIIIGFAANIIVSFISVGFMMLSPKNVLLGTIVATIIVGLFINPFLSLFTDRALGSLYNERVKDFDIDEKYIIN